MRNWIKIGRQIGLGFIVLHSFLVSAQTTLQVATKNIERTLPYKAGYELSIEGEKADVVVQSGTSGVVKVSVEITSKNPNAAEAQKDLEQVQFDAEVQGRRVILRNFTRPYSNGQKPKSSIKTSYKIYVPSECGVSLKSSFGKVNLSNLVNFLQSQTEFSSVTLQNIKGKVNVDTKFGDVIGKNIDGDVRINARRSNVTISQLRGSYSLNMSHGKANITADVAQINLNLTGDNTDVFFYPHGRAYNYDLNAKNGQIDLPQNVAFSVNDYGSNGKNASYKPQNVRNMVTIKVNFGNVKVVN